MDITSEYKTPDGHGASSSAEKMQKGSLHTTMTSTFSSIGTHYMNEDFDKVTVDLNLESSVMLGSDSLFSLKIENGADEDLSVNINIFVHSIFFNGSKYRLIKFQKNKVQIKRKQSVVEEMIVSYNDYAKKLSVHNLIRIECFGDVVEKNWDFFVEETQRLVSPELVIRLVGEREMYKKILIEVTFMNALKVPLRAVQFCLEESSSSYGAVVNMNEIKPLNVATAKFFVIPYKVGKYLLTVKLKTSEFQTETITEFHVFN